MKIIKQRTEKLEEGIFSKKKPEPAPPPVKVEINHEWDKYYNTLEDIRNSGVSPHLAGMYFREGTAISDELLGKVFASWMQNYEELSRQLHWDKKR